MTLAQAGAASAQAVQTGSGFGLESIGIGLGVVGAAIGAGIVVAGAGKGIGNIGGSAVEAIARQPEAKGSISTNMIISAALIEGFTFFALIIVLIALGYLPKVIGG
jgi:F-type H+-transporting ATPase subunit c